jgi:hypothetical protein
MAVALGLLALPEPARARSAPQPLEGQQCLVFFLGGIPRSTHPDLYLNIWVNQGEVPVVHGSIHDGTSNTVLVAERYSSSASCADVDNDGIAGLTSLQLVMRNVRTHELLPVSIVPTDGEIDDRDVEDVTIVIGNMTFVERVRTHVVSRSGR